MGDREWLQQQLNRYSYKPGWTFYIRSTQYLVHVLGIDIAVPNSRTPDHGPTTVNNLLGIPDVVYETRDPELFYQLWRTAIQIMEDHERDEWLRRDGQLIDDPHGGR